MDWTAWVNRAKQFTDNLRTLPGEIEITSDIAPPLSEREAEKLAARLPRGLPSSLRDFFTHGSASCECRYAWTPPESLLPELAKAIPGYVSGVPSPALKAMLPDFAPDIFGGASLGNAREFEEYQKYAIDWANSFDEDEDCAKDAELWHRCTLFAPIPNGDFLGLDASSPDGSHPVVYLSHEGGGGSQVISPNLEQFAKDWEKICYIGPDLFLLNEWRDHLTKFKCTGYLKPDSPKTEILRSLLIGSGPRPSSE